MRAMTVVPGLKGTAGIEEVPDPDMQDGALLVRGTAAGVCGTGREIAEGAYGTPPPGKARLVIGHESLGEVREAPAGSGFAPGDPVVGIVRRPDPAPCPACAAGEWDMRRLPLMGFRAYLVSPVLVSKLVVLLRRVKPSHQAGSGRYGAAGRPVASVSTR